MEHAKIATLLEKYFDGATTIDDEKQLTNYFSSNNVSQEFEQYIPMFNYFELEKQSVYKREINLKSNKKPIWLSMAAAIVLLCGLGTYYYMNNKSASKENDLGTFKSPEIAFAETLKALQLLSSNVNVGINSVAYIDEYQNTKNKIFIE